MTLHVRRTKQAGAWLLAQCCIDLVIQGIESAAPSTAGRVAPHDLTHSRRGTPDRLLNLSIGHRMTGFHRKLAGECRIYCRTEQVLRLMLIRDRVHVGHRRSETRRARSRRRCRVNRVTCGCMSGHRQSAQPGSSLPATREFDDTLYGRTRACIRRCVNLEQRQHPRSAFGGPQACTAELIQGQCHDGDAL